MNLRKELVCFIETTEQGIEASVRAMKGDPSAVLIEHEGHKFAISIQSLAKALGALNDFYERDKLQYEELSGACCIGNTEIGKPVVLGAEHGLVYPEGMVHTTGYIQISGDAGSYKDIEYGAME